MKIVSTTPLRRHPGKLDQVMTNSKRHHTNNITTRIICWSGLAVACLLTSPGVRADPAFSDANWISMGGSLPGANGPVYATAVDGSGNLYIAGNFTVVGGILATNIAKWNGSNWSALGLGLSGPRFYGQRSLVSALAVSGSDLYASGVFTNAGGVAAHGIAKWNGSSWSALGSGLGGVPADQLQVSALAVSGNDLYAGGWFKTAGGVAATNVARWNGSSWSALSSGMNGVVYALAASGSSVYAGGYFTTAGGITASNIARWNGSAWSALGLGIAGTPFGALPVLALAVSGSDVYVGGTFTRAGGVASTNIAKWNGSSWSAIGPGILRGVLTLAMSGSNLFAGGEFVPQNGPAYGIARWNGSSWSAVSPGMNNGVYVLAVLGSDLYAGGGFSTIGGGTNANYIARWNGNSWSPLGSGIGGIQNPSVSTLAVSGTNLYVGGRFTTSGGVAATNIARWNGTDWSALSSGINGFGVYALAVLGNDLYAGGSFTNAGGIAASNIAKWNGSNWSALSWTGAVSLNGVSALTVCGSNLIAAGVFSTNGGALANHVATWDGTSWTVLGSAFGNPVWALAVVVTNLYAGGEFGTADGSPFDHIAKWDGNSWSAVGSGLGVYSGAYHYVDALVVSGSNLYAGGIFATVDGIALNHIAKWDGSSWSALGSGMNGAVSALAVLGNDLYAGGSFTTAGGKVSVNLARARLSFAPDNLVLRANVADVPTNTLSFAGVPGFPYVVQYATNLSGSPWFTLSTNAPAANGIGAIFDPAATDSQRFYRVGFEE
jgi:trimeric autotransporter adhesin